MAKQDRRTKLTYSQINPGESDEYFELRCTQCSKGKLHKQATKYCANCKEYFCVSCLKNHNSFKVLSGHVLVEAEVQVLPTELCKQHHLEVINMYCAGHDSVGCSVCFALDHKSCNDIHYIPEYVQTTFPSQQVRQINNELTKAIKEMKTLQKLHESLDDNVDKSKSKCKEEIQKYRDDINQILDQIEATTLAELDARHKYTRHEIDNTKHNIDAVHDELVRFKSEIESDQSNDSQKFVKAKLSQCMIKRGQELQSELLVPHDNTRELTFTRNTDVMTFLLSIVALGMLTPPMVQDSTHSTVTTSGKQPQQTQSNESSASGDRKNKTGSTRQKATMKPQKHELRKKVDKSKYNIQEQDDEETCDIQSSCILDNGDILLLDNNNDKLKLVDGRTYRVRSSLTLGTVPQSVCRVTSTEVAVCLYDETIQFVSTCEKLVPTRLRSMKHTCKCKTVTRDKIYVCGNKTLFIYKLNGKLKKTITKDKQKHYIFSSICDITVSDDEKMIHVADMDKGVITLDTDGKVVWRYSDKDLNKARGVCTDGAGNVIVCGYWSHNVIQLGPGGQYIGEIVTRSDGVIHPWTVCYDRNNHKLIVGMTDSNTMKVFTVK